jgi:hypothetical protein
MTGLPKFTKQKLVCSKLEKKAGLMICANEDLSAKRGPFYIFQVVVDKDAGTDPEAMERIPHRITVCPPFQLENLLPVSIQVRTRTRTHTHTARTLGLSSRVATLCSTRCRFSETGIGCVSRTGTSPRVKRSLSTFSIPRPTSTCRSEWRVHTTFSRARVTN